MCDYIFTEFFLAKENCMMFLTLMVLLTYFVEQKTAFGYPRNTVIN